jgi:hypothetical protein
VASCGGRPAPNAEPTRVVTIAPLTDASVTPVAETIVDAGDVLAPPEPGTSWAAAPMRARDDADDTPPVRAKLGEPLEPGHYVFPDGLELRVTHLTACDFDVSVPCFGGTYRAEAKLRGKTARVDWSTRTTQILDHTIELSRMRIIVTKVR